MRPAEHKATDCVTNYSPTTRMQHRGRSDDRPGRIHVRPLSRWLDAWKPMWMHGLDAVCTSAVDGMTAPATMECASW